MFSGGGMAKLVKRIVQGGVTIERTAFPFARQLGQFCDRWPCKAFAKTIEHSRRGHVVEVRAVGSLNRTDPRKTLTEDDCGEEDRCQEGAGGEEDCCEKTSQEAGREGKDDGPLLLQVAAGSRRRLAPPPRTLRDFDEKGPLGEMPSGPELST